MTVQVPIKRTHTDLRGASIDAARWRAQCVQYYGEIEFLAGVALRELRASGHELTSQPLFTYRTKLAALREVIAKDNGRLFRMLDQLYHACDRRNLIIHASGSISLTQDGSWVWTAYYIPGDLGETVAEAITQTDGEGLEEDLRRSVQSLTSHLDVTRKKKVVVKRTPSVVHP